MFQRANLNKKLDTNEVGVIKRLVRTYLLTSQGLVGLYLHPREEYSYLQLRQLAIEIKIDIPLYALPVDKMPKRHRVVCMWRN